jgi:EAL domain-containing protein (putative c-di-GMP-specific phosphodiesterase class I)
VDLEQWRARIATLVAVGGPVIAYQPVVELWGSRVVGYEALARFSDGSPDDWFGAAHATGQGTELELSAVHAALRASPADGPVYTAVNVCPHVICDTDDLSFLADRRPRITLEVTEHEAIPDYDELAERLAPLRIGGVRLSIDDVGAGFASFRHILELAPDSIKLDRSLVTGVDLEEQEDRRALIAAMALFASRAGVRMVAEGIEREGECQVLRTLGVKYGQGFLFGRPQVPVL